MNESITLPGERFRSREPVSVRVVHREIVRYPVKETDEQRKLREKQGRAQPMFAFTVTQVRR